MSGQLENTDAASAEERFVVVVLPTREAAAVAALAATVALETVEFEQSRAAARGALKINAALLAADEVDQEREHARQAFVRAYLAARGNGPGYLTAANVAFEEAMR